MRERHLFWDVAPVVLLTLVALLLAIQLLDGHRSWGLLQEVRNEQKKMVANAQAAQQAQTRQLELLTQRLQAGATVGGGNASAPGHSAHAAAFRPPGYEDLPPDVPIPVLPNLPTGDEQADDGDWYVAAMLAEPNSLNAMVDNDATASELFNQVHDPLAGRLFEDLEVWEPYLARAWKKEMICRAYTKGVKAADLAAEIKARWDAQRMKALQLKEVTAESDDVLVLKIDDVNNDYREALTRDFGDRLWRQWWFYVEFKGQKFPDRTTDLTGAALAPRLVGAVEQAPGFQGRVLPPWNREDSVVLKVLGDEKARDAAQAALNRVLAAEDNRAWVIDPKEASGGRMETCMSCNLVEDYIAQEQPVFTFYLRKDVKWDDGVPFSGKDVVFTYRTIQNPRTECGPIRNYLQDCVGCELVNDDPYVVRFTWARPYFDAFANSAGFNPIAEHHYRFEDPNTFNTGPQNQKLVGNGAYKLEKWERGVEFVFVRNENYYGRKPHFKKVVYRIVKDPTVQLQLFEAGETDIYGLRPSQMKVKEKDPTFREKFAVNISVGNNYRYIGWNARNKLFASRQVRQALTRLVDRERICRDIMQGYALLQHGPVHPQNPMYWKEIEEEGKRFGYDPPAAIRQLAEAGWKDTDGDGILDKDGQPFKFTLLIVSNNPETESIAGLVKESFGKAGIQVNINNLEWAAFLQKIERLQFDACILGWALGMTEDPYQLWHSSQVDEKESNFCYFVNPEADRLIEKARTELNEKKRAALLAQFQRIILEEQPYTFLFVSKRLTAYDKRIQNVQYKLVGSNWSRWWVPKALQKRRD